MAEPHRFLASEPLLAPGEYALGPEESHHAFRVMRMAAGDAITLFDGFGRYGAAAISLADRDRVTARITEILEDSRPRVHLTIATAMPKGKRWQVLVEKCTELGVDRILPLLLDRSVAKGEGDPARWRRWAIEAAKQSRRARLPEILEPGTLAAAIALAEREAAALFVGSPGGESPKAYAAPLAASGKALIVIGPEGGLSEREREWCGRAAAAEIRLSPFALRIETAAAAACTLIRDAV
ncbi:MAG: 16S rRNA (uracil(1498)-N(3))-methyltransferase [Planctomycetota bacterium]|jgi:16S rRNA (uracil1498-N3)-methyltransferase|nr:16S rRNA (uracil(1498)-N(3))-methyltransferase [Planctomycetota bacterium]